MVGRCWDQHIIWILLGWRRKLLLLRERNRDHLGVHMHMRQDLLIHLGRIHLMECQGQLQLLKTRTHRHILTVWPSFVLCRICVHTWGRLGTTWLTRVTCGWLLSVFGTDSHESHRLLIMVVTATLGWILQFNSEDQFLSSRNHIGVLFGLHLNSSRPLRGSLDWCLLYQPLCMGPWGWSDLVHRLWCWYAREGC